MSWQVLLYQSPNGDSPVEDFIQNLPAKDQSKIFYSIELLEQFGIQLRLPHTKALAGHKNLFELRIQQANNIHRIFYFHYTGKTFVLLHGFTKKTQKTPEKEIRLAIDRQKDFLKKQGD